MRAEEFFAQPFSSECHDIVVILLQRRELGIPLDREGVFLECRREHGGTVVEWLVEEAESLGGASPDEAALAEVLRLRRRGRAVARFVRLWSLEGDRGAASQLAASERFAWPLPDGPVEASLLMARFAGTR